MEASRQREQESLANLEQTDGQTIRFTPQREEHELPQSKLKAQQHEEGLHRMVEPRSKRVRLNVGGTYFVTLASSLQREPHSLLACFGNGRWEVDKEDGAFFIDRDPVIFAVILNYLRSGTLLEEEVARVGKKVLLKEAEYFLLDQLAAQLRDGGILAAELTRKDVWKLCSSLKPKSLREMRLCGLDLSMFDMRGWDLSYADLRGANLFSARLSKAKLYNTNLSGTHLFCAELTDADLTSANLSNAKLSNADLSNAVLTNSDLANATLSGAKLYNCALTNTNLSRTDLSGATLSCARATRADLSRANLSGATIRFANLEEATLTQANLQNANLTGTNLSKAICTGCILEQACLSSTKTKHAIDLPSPKDGGYKC